MPSTKLPGNVGSVVEMTVGKKGGYISNFSFGVDGGMNGNKGERRTTWFSVSCFGKLAEKAERLIKVGMKLVLTGYPYIDQWEDKETGEKRYRARFNCFGFREMVYTERDLEDDAEAEALAAASKK